MLQWSSCLVLLWNLVYTKIQLPVLYVFAAHKKGYQNLFVLKEALWVYIDIISKEGTRHKLITCNNWSGVALHWSQVPISQLRKWCLSKGILWAFVVLWLPIHCVSAIILYSWFFFNAMMKWWPQCTWSLSSEDRGWVYLKEWRQSLDLVCQKIKTYRRLEHFYRQYKTKCFALLLFFLFVVFLGGPKFLGEGISFCLPLCLILPWRYLQNHSTIFNQT